MMTLQFFLPIGEPDLVQTQADTDEFLQTLPQYEAPFGGDQVFALYRPPDDIPLPDEYKTIVAMMTGVAHYDPVTGSIRLQLKYSTVKTLEGILGPELPLPTRITYGPVVANFSGSKIISAGQPLGQFEGDVFFISLQDQNHYFLDPHAYFQLLEQHDLWKLPDGVRCPLISPTDINGPVAIAGPNPVALGQPFLTVSGGSLGWQIHNPPNPLPTHYCSFLSSDTISLTVGNLATNQTASLRLKDVSQAMYQTHASPKYVNLAAATAWNIIPQEQLNPYHQSYKKENGEKSVGKSLSYELKVTLSNPSDTLLTTISQDQKDIIRQEYLFHSKPFQSGNTVLPIPTRKQLERNHKPDFVKHFKPWQLQCSNYDAENGNWILNRVEAYHVAEYMRRQFAEHLAILRVAGALPDKIFSYDLTITSSWRNPERNEWAGGVIDSDHLYGYALDMRSTHKSDSDRHNTERQTLNHELFKAGRTFLERLTSINGSANCLNVKILLMQSTELLWLYSVAADGSVISAPGNAYATIVGSQPTDKQSAIRKAALHANHVQIGWRPLTLDDPLTLPDIAPYDTIAPSPANLFRNILLIAAVDDSRDGQLPLNHVAASLKSHLERIDPDTPTDIYVVSNALEYLEHCNAFRPPAYKIKYFFSFSHAWDGGLVLESYGDDVPYLRPAGSTGEQIHDQALFEDINFMYGDPRPTEGVPLLPIGKVDTNTIRTHQMRVSNMNKLPDMAKQYMRMTFAETSGIFIVGCNTAGYAEYGKNAPLASFSKAFANVVGKTVRGAIYPSNVFQFMADGKWHKVSLERQDNPPDSPIILAPGSGPLDAIFTDKPILPHSSDLLKIYQKILIPVHPDKKKE